MLSILERTADGSNMRVWRVRRSEIRTEHSPECHAFVDSLTALRDKPASGEVVMMRFPSHKIAFY